jgi:AAA family ATP:ADP antiporter
MLYRLMRALLRSSASTTSSEREVHLVSWAAVCMCSATCVVYIVQPLRDAQALVFGKQHLPTLILLATVLSALTNPLVGWLFGDRKGRGDKGGTTPALVTFYRFVGACLMGFYFARSAASAAGAGGAAGDGDTPLTRAVAAVFFLFGSVSNILLMSLSWGHCSEVFDAEQAMRLFGVVAAACTAGQFVGSSAVVGAVHLAGGRDAPSFVLAAVLLELCAFAAKRMKHVALCAAAEDQKEGLPASEVAALKPPSSTESGADAAATGGAAAASGWRKHLRGAELIARSPYLLAIFSYTGLYGGTGTLIYMEKLALMQSALGGGGARASFSAQLNLLVAVGTLTIQLIFSAKLVKWLGVRRTLLLLPLTTLVAAIGMARSANVSLAFVAGIETLRKIANYAVTKPIREALFSVVTQDERYQCKSFIDTFSNRVGSSAAATLFALHNTAPLLYRGTFLGATIGWALTCSTLQREHSRRAEVQAH